MMRSAEPGYIVATEPPQKGQGVRKRKGKRPSNAADRAENTARVPAAGKNIINHTRSAPSTTLTGGDDPAFLAAVLGPSPYYLSRWLFLRGIGLVYLVAFASLYVQVPGLLGHEGITPVDSFLSTISGAHPNTKYWEVPTVIWWLQDHLGMTADGALHGICLLGMAISAVVTVFGLSFAPLFALLWICYGSLYSVGQTFLSFQWDILLLEAGFLSIFVAPLWSFKSKLGDVLPSPVSVFMIRWLLFRLMFLSGAVKLLSQCPTWWNLTALHYHYETQCIPNAMAWFAHHLPDCIQRLSVAAVFVVELLCPFWILIPNRLVLIAAAIPQILLQLLIILTGNYNFFNWLTILLCIPLLDDLFLAKLMSLPSSIRNKIVDSQPYSRKKIVRIFNCFILVITIGLTAWFTSQTVNFHWERFDLASPNKQHKTPAITLNFGQKEWTKFLSLATPYSIYIGFGLFVFYSLIHAGQLIFAFFDHANNSNSKRGWLSRVWKLVTNFTRLAFGLCIIGILFAIFLSSTVPYTNRLDTKTYSGLPELCTKAYRLGEKFHVTNSYGLFARMTTERPEIIVEGTNDGMHWKAYEFRYKAGRQDRAPPIVAPHQPRLDWQMWFAALGTYQHAPWFVNFLVRLLHNSSPVLELLESNPFPDSPPKYIRSVLYDYRFTSPANNSLLTEVEMDIDKFLLGQKVDTSPLFRQGRDASIKHNSNWWNAQPSKEYLSLTLSKEVEAYLKHFGWSMKVKKLRFGTTTSTSTWEGWIVNRLFPLWAPCVPLFVAFCVATALMPACLFGRLFCN